MTPQRSFSIKKIYQKVTGSGGKKKKQLGSFTASPSMHSRALDFTEDAVVDQSFYEETSMRSEYSTLANIRREEIFYKLTPTGRNAEEVEQEVRISNLKKCNEELFEINVGLSQKANLSQQRIAALKLKLANERKEAANAQYAILKKHQAELNEKEEELNRKEIEIIKQFSSMKVSQNSIQIDALKTSDSLQKVQSTPFAHSTPTSLSNQKKDVKNFAVSIPSHHLSPVQESQEIAPVVISAKIESLLRDLIIYSFQLRDSSNKSSKYVNDWLSNVQPQIAPPNMRANFLEMKKELEELSKGGIEKVLDTASKTIKASTEMTLQLTQKLKDLKEREDKREDASIRYESFQDKSMYNDTTMYKF